MKRILSLVLVLLMLGSLLVACQSTPTETPKDTTAQSGDVNSEKPDDSEKNPSSDTSDGGNTDDKGFIKDTLPDDIDYDGKKVSMLGWKDCKNTAWPEEGNANDPIQDTSYWHKKSVEDRMGIEFDVYYESAGWSAQATFLTTARSEDAAYDLIQSQLLLPPVLAQEGRLSNLKKLQYPDLEKPWWPDSVELWTQYGALFYIGSNSSANSLGKLTVLFANQNMIAEAGLGNPVKLALRGGWTFEQMRTYSRSFAGLAEANPGEIYGFACDAASRLDSLYYASGFTGTLNNADGIAELCYDDKETLEQIVNMIDLYVEFFGGVETKINNTDTKQLYEETTAFFLGCLELIRKVDDSETYAVLPLPKLTEEQTEYATIHSDATDIWCIPISASDKELSGIILEANASAEYRSVAPFFFDQYLKKRYSSDAEGMQCFELIRDSIVYDFGKANYFASIHVDNMFRSCFYTYGSNPGVTVKNIFMTEYAKEIEAKRLALTKLLEDYQKYKDQ